MNRLPKLVGYAALWSAVSSTPRTGHYMRFACGAFGDSTDFDDVKALFQHNWECALAFNGDRREGGILSLREDGRGLAFEIEPYEDREWIERVVSEIRAGHVRGMSVGFRVIERCFDTLASGLLVETITRARLREISPVYSPLFRETSVRLVEPAPVKARPAEPVASPEMYRSVVYMKPEGTGARRVPARSGSAAVNC